MGVRHHRGVDRMTAILEQVAKDPDGLTLTEISRRLDAPVSSVQQLVNGLLAVGYLVEHNKRHYVGPGVFALTMAADWSLMAPVKHEQLEQLACELQCRIVLGVMVGEGLVYVDAAGESSASRFFARAAMRRPLLPGAAGKLLLAGLPDTELFPKLTRIGETVDFGVVDKFLHEIAEIRSTGLSWSRAGSIPDVDAVATGLAGRGGSLAAAVVATGQSTAIRSRLDAIGHQLLASVRGWHIDGGG